jgi:Asparagine synthase
VHGLVVGFGRAADFVSHAALLSRLPGLLPEQIHLRKDVAGARVAVLDAGLVGALPPVSWTSDRVLGLALTGYLLLDEPGPVAEHPTRWLQAVRTRGLSAALRDIAAGSYVLATLEPATGEVCIANDPMGTVAVFYAEVAGGGIVTTIPSLLRLDAMLPPEPDWTAAAQIVYIGYTLSRRYMLAGSHRLPTASILRWLPHAKRFDVRPSDHDPLRAALSTAAPNVDDVADRIEAACGRLARLGGRTANLLSGGMDSRLLLAAWPPELMLPCYSYGPAEIADVAVARRAAAVRGQGFVHVPLPPDEVAASIEDISRFGGPPSFPNRYLAARRIRMDGFENVLDGYLGDVFLGGSYYRDQRQLRRHGRIEGKLGWMRDVSAARLGLDALAELIWTDLVDPGSDAWARSFFGPDAAARFASRKDEIRQDIWNDLRPLAARHDSALRLLRDYRAANRSAHYIAQQGMLCRRFLRPYFPLTNDRAVMEVLASLRPQQVGQRRLQIRLFRRRYPDYAAVPYAGSLLPLGRHPLAHVWAPTFQQLGLPLLRPAVNGTVPRYDEWDAWLRGSPRLRDYTVRQLTAMGMADTATLQTRMDEIAAGRERGSGELVHLASVAALLSPERARA